MDTIEILKKRIQELLKEKDDYFHEANARLLAYDVAIGELNKIIVEVEKNG